MRCHEVIICTRESRRHKSAARSVAPFCVAAGGAHTPPRRPRSATSGEPSAATPCGSTARRSFQGAASGSSPRETFSRPRRDTRAAQPERTARPFLVGQSVTVFRLAPAAARTTAAPHASPRCRVAVASSWWDSRLHVLEAGAAGAVPRLDLPRYRAVGAPSQVGPSRSLDSQVKASCLAVPQLARPGKFVVLLGAESLSSWPQKPRPRAKQGTGYPHRLCSRTAVYPRTV